MTVISLSKIRCDGGTQFRAALDPAVITEYTEAMLGGDVFPAVVLFFDGEAYWLADGFYRCAASREAHLDEITADVRQGTQRDARLYAATDANRAHGCRMSNEEKRARVEAVLQDEEGRRWSDREIARRCGVDGKTVATLRNQLRNSAVDEPRQGADGKVRKLPRKPEDVIRSLDDVGASNNAAARHEEEPCLKTKTTETTKTKTPLSSAAPTAARASSGELITSAPAKTPGKVTTGGERVYQPILGGQEGAVLEGLPVRTKQAPPAAAQMPDLTGCCESTAEDTLGWVAELLGAEADGAALSEVRRIIETRILELPREGYRQGEMAALSWVAEHVLLLPAVPGDDLDALRGDIELTVGSLREAAPGPGPGEGEAELQELLQQAREDAAGLRGQISSRAGELAAARSKVAGLQKELGTAIAEQVRYQKDAAQARAEISHLQKEVSALKGQLALPRATPEVELDREGWRIGEQVIWGRKKSVRALIVAWTGRGSAHLWVRPNPTAKSAEGRSGHWELAGLAELTPDPQQDGPGAVRAALDALERHPDSPWLPGLRAAYSRIVAEPQVEAQEEAPYRPSRCGKAKVVHAVGRQAPAHGAALCTFRPSYSSKGWVEAVGAAIDCEGCLERIGRQP